MHLHLIIWQTLLSKSDLQLRNTASNLLQIRGVTIHVLVLNIFRTGLSVRYARKPNTFLYFFRILRNGIVALFFDISPHRQQSVIAPSSLLL